MFVLSLGSEARVSEVHEEDQEVSRGRRAVAVQVRRTRVGDGEFTRPVVLSGTCREVVRVGVRATCAIEGALAVVAQERAGVEVASVGVVASKG